MNAIDALLLAPALAAGGEREELLSALSELTDHEHPRVRRARLHRDDVRVFGHAAGGLVLVPVGSEALLVKD